nr:hypothetical protein [candidate division Zixibacteria bacterium]
MRIIPYILYLFLLALHLTILADITSIYGAVIDLTALLVTMVALYKGETTTLWFALCAAIIAGTQRLDLMPWEMFALPAIGLAANHISSKLNLDSSLSRILILAAFLFIHGILMTLLISTSDFIYMFFRSIIPGTVYSLIIGWLFFQLKDGRITWQKAKALF